MHVLQRKSNDFKIVNAVLHCKKSALQYVVLKNPPCFRSGLMWGIAMGTALGAHRFRITRSMRKACDGAVLAFGLIGSGSWLLCTTSYRVRARQTREFMEAMNDPKRKAEAQEFLRSRVHAPSSDDEQH
uniref:Cytochrome c oxidase assembly protein COX20, mitochondrial n=1 Tax=Peronospora matthiolae TaxID=2874970 RepID=A0AAV1TDD0_9STRA